MLMRKSQNWPTLSIRTIHLRFNAGIADAGKMDLAEIQPDSALMPGLISHVVIEADNRHVLYWKQPIFRVFLVFR